MRKQLCGKEEMCLVSVCDVQTMQKSAESMMESEYSWKKRDGEMIKWTLESLGLWGGENDACSPKTQC